MTENQSDTTEKTTETTEKTDTTAHPTLDLLKSKFAGQGIKAGQFRGDTTIIVPKELSHAVLQFLREEPQADYDLLSDVFGIDYLNYPGQTDGRFAVVYNLVSVKHNHRLIVKVFLDPSLDTTGIEDDPTLHIPSVTDIWAGAEWNERETFDMFGIHFDNHPDHRRILCYEEYPAHPLRKDYPLNGRGEREQFPTVDRDAS